MNERESKVIKCLGLCLLELVICMILFQLNMPNQDVVLFIFLSAVIVWGGYNAGICCGAIICLYSVFYFSVNHSMTSFTASDIHNIGVVTLGVIANIIVVGRLQRNNRQVIKRMAAIEAQNQKKQELTELNAISNALSDIYTGVFFIDLIKDEFMTLKAQDRIISLFQKNPSASEAIKYAMEKTVVSSNLKEMLEYVDLSTLAERMGKERYLNKEYKGKFSGWIRGSFIEVMRNQNGNVTQVLYTYQIIGREKKLQMEKQELLQETAEAANAANKAKSSFLFNMSHDIRTPMNAILGFNILAEKNMDHPEKLKDCLEKIKTCSQGMLAILDNILELSRIESGKVVLEEEANHVENVLEDCLVMTRADAEKKHQKITVSKTIQYPYLYFDRTRIMEIILNLLSNANKYTGENGKIICSLKQKEHPKDGWIYQIITVADNGIGMSKEFQNHIFETFSREHTSTNSGIQGTGLGMGIVKKLVDMMDGTIKVKSKLGEGSTFTIKLPCRIASYEDTQPKKESNVTDHADLIGKRILLAEDFDMNAEIAINLLEDEGLIVERAKNGVECVEMIENAPNGYYAVILMDIQMPMLDGYDATRKIRKLSVKEKAAIPIIAMTANAFTEDKKKALEIGMDDYIPKPIDMNKLIPALQKYM